jgi:phosphate transport system substrate-binding protein
VNRSILRNRLLAGTAVLAIVLTAGCANRGSDKDLSGNINVDGSSTVGPLTRAAAESFNEDEPQIKVSVSESGTGGGFEKFCNGETDISDASRPIEDDEKTACQSSGVKYAELIVANDALAVVVNKDNDFIKCLTVDQLKKLWSKDSQVKKWNQLDPSFPAEDVKLFGPGTDSGTFDYFTDAINGEEGNSRTDYTASEDDNVLVQGVGKEKSALGYFGYTYAEQNAETIKTVEVDAGGGCVAPSARTAQEGTYKPLSRPLFIYVSEKALERDEVQAFVDYYVENIKDIATEESYVPLTDEQAKTLQGEYDKLKQA